MNYISALFLLIFLPAVMLMYQIIPQKFRWIILLLSSYAFFYSISKTLIVYLILSTFSIHYMGIWLESMKKGYLEQRSSAPDKNKLKSSYTRKQRGIVFFGILINIGILLVLKYSLFFSDNMNHFFKMSSIPVSFPLQRFAVPIGISFYTLQAISYISDVYYGKIEADKNLARLALYLSFFPTIMEGPICRYSETAVTLYEGNPLKYKNITFGMQRVIWGLFKKLIIADRLNVFVSAIFDFPEKYNGSMILISAILYTIQLYADFSGCIDMTIGMGEIFGITIPENFRRPFFSRTASEFWRRWHITLGTWFKDYIFYPISLTKFIKKLTKRTKSKFGKHIGQLIPTSIALFAVWVCNGLWHGTGWKYLFFGLYYFVLIVLGNAFEPLIETVTSKLKINRNSVLYRIFQTLKMFTIIVVGELFFRAKGLTPGISMLKSIFTNFKLSTFYDGSIWNLNLKISDFLLVLISLILLLIVGILQERNIRIREKISSYNLAIRWAIYYAAILSIIILGAYGEGYLPASMIYANF